MNAQRPLRLVIGCDTDPDRLDFGGIPFNCGSRPQVWAGLERITTLRTRLDSIMDSNGRRPAITWFLRCDEQMKITEGAHGAALERFSDLWRRLQAAGDELGWHPHFWRLADDGNTWFHEMEDETFQTRMLDESFQAFASSMGFTPTSVRMGWDYHNNASIQTLARLGIRIDLSALPYQRFAGSHNDRGASFAGFFDWSSSGSKPYRPSQQDYRVPGGSDAVPILELPQNLLQSSLSGCLSEARGALRDRSPKRLIRALGPQKSVVNTTVKACSPPFLFRAMIRDVLRRDEDWIATYFHPDELLERKGSLVNDWIHRMSYFTHNVKSVVEIAGRHGRSVEFVTATEAAELLRP